MGIASLCDRNASSKFPRGLLVLEACSPGEWACELPAIGHGVFSAALLKALRDLVNPSNLEFARAVSQYAAELAVESRYVQHPRLTLVGDVPPLLESDAGARRVLSVGIDKYSDPERPSLHFAEADARALHDAFIARGYTGTLILGAEARLDFIVQAIAEGLRGLREEDLLVIAFSGFGVCVEGRNGILPVDASFGATRQGIGVLFLDQLQVILQDCSCAVALLLDIGPWNRWDR